MLSPPRAARLHVERLAARDAPPPRRPKIKMTYIKHIVLALAMATAAAETPKLRGRVLEEETPSETVPNRVIGPDETTANKGLIGVDEVPAQIGALVEGVLVPYIGSFPGLDDLLLDHVRKAYEAEKFNYCWRIELDADGDMQELTFGRAGARISEQSENAAAVVVYL